MEDQCESCGYQGRGLSAGAVAAGLSELPAQVRTLVDGVDHELLRRRPVPGRWSALEYLGHLRDLMAFHRWVIERATAEESPVIDPADPDAAVAAAAYNDADVQALLAQFERRVQRLVEVLGDLPESTSRRRVTVDIAQGPIDVMTVARSALHEGRHHLADIQRLVGSESSGGADRRR